jgi:hypothetical protein
VRSAELSVIGLAPGVFQVVLGDSTFVQRDTNAFPFVEDVSLSSSPGTVLVTLTIVPEPSTALLLLSGLLGLGGVRRRVRPPFDDASRVSRDTANGAS